MNILVITRGSWNINNNTGNTLEKLFCNLKNCNIYNLYMRDEESNNSCSKLTFKISEQNLIKNLFSKKEVGEVVRETYFSKYINQDKENEEKIYNFAKKIELYLLWFIREIIWFRGNWKSKKLDDFLEEISPDIIFMPAFGCWYPHKVLKYIYKRTNAKVVLYHADDTYSLKQYHFSPVYWIYRFILRKYIKKSVEISSINYCISEMQVEEYSNYFNKKCLLLRKGYENRNIVKKNISNPIKIIFTGNISSGRWKTLRAIGKTLDEINKEKIIAELFIYSGTPLNLKMKEEFDKIFSLKFMGKISSEEVIKVQEKADILVHAESFDLKDLLEVRLSFSTKIIDYINMKKCILAVGPKNIASIQYFIQNNIGCIVFNEKELKNKMISLLNENMINSYEKNVIKFLEEKNLVNEDPGKILYKKFLTILKTRDNF